LIFSTSTPIKENATTKNDEFLEETATENSMRRSLIYRFRNTEHRKMYDSKEYQSRQDMASTNGVSRDKTLIKHIAKFSVEKIYSYRTSKNIIHP
jgi:hypothetical protein